MGDTIDRTWLTRGLHPQHRLRLRQPCGEKRRHPYLRPSTWSLHLIRFEQNIYINREPLRGRTTGGVSGGLARNRLYAASRPSTLVNCKSGLSQL